MKANGAISFKKEKEKIEQQLHLKDLREYIIVSWQQVLPVVYKHLRHTTLKIHILKDLPFLAEVS